MPYEWKPQDIEWHLDICEQQLRQKRKGFLHHIMTSNEKWIHYDNPECRKLWGKPSHASISETKPNIHASKLWLCIW